MAFEQGKADVNPQVIGNEGATPAERDAHTAATPATPAERDAEHVPVFSDALFRKKRKKGRYTLVEPPLPPLEGPVADTHAHVHLLYDPAGALAMAGAWGVSFVADVVDIVEDAPEVWDAMPGWLDQAQALIPEYRAGARETYGRNALPTWDDAESTSQAPHVRFIVGCHPHNAKDFDAAARARLTERLADLRVAALGEIGLDYHYDFSPRDVQQRVFAQQLEMAREAGLPVSLHLREAHDDALAILREVGFPPEGTLLHCFNLGSDVLRPFLEEGCYFAFGGPVTFKAADEVREAARLVPADRLLTETDSPYMTPEPMRGMICGPAHTIYTAARLAEVRGFAPGPGREAFLSQIWDNAHQLLNQSR